MVLKIREQVTVELRIHSKETRWFLVKMMHVLTSSFGKFDIRYHSNVTVRTRVDCKQ